VEGPPQLSMFKQHEKPNTGKNLPVSMCKSMAAHSLSIASGNKPVETSG